MATILSYIVQSLNNLFLNLSASFLYPPNSLNKSGILQGTTSKTKSDGNNGNG